MKHLACIVSFVFFISTTKAQLIDTIVVRFDYNKSILTSEAVATIGHYLSLQKDFNIQSIALYGHCDFIGDDLYNDSLSRERVLSVKQFLVAQQNFSFVEERGHGKRKPADIGKTDAARALNRRVEIIVQKQPKVQEPLKVDTVVERDPEAEPYRPLAERIKDSSIKVGSNLVLRNLNFIGGRHILVFESTPILEELLEVMEANPGLEIEIQGHVCCVRYEEDGFDFDTHTHDLSIRRAKAVYDFLVKNGIAKERMRFKGFGGSQKIYPAERTEREQALNRRVEIKILKK